MDAPSYPFTAILSLSGGIRMGWEESVLALVAVAGVALTAIKTFWEMRKDRQTARQMLDVIEGLRKSTERNEKEIETLRIAFENKLTTKSQEDLKKRQLELKAIESQRKNEKDEWRKLVQIAKGIGWFLKRSEED
jgi:hypothetical protein